MAESGVGCIDGESVVEAVVGDITGESAGQGSLGGAGVSGGATQGSGGVDIKEPVGGGDDASTKGEGGCLDIAGGIDLEKIAISDDADVDAMKGWRRQLFGEDALKLKRGEIALVLSGSRVEVVEIEG